MHRVPLQPVQTSFITSQRSIQPGKAFSVAVHLKIDKNWHAYWKNPGESGFPLSVEWTLPPGFQAGPLQWPIPQRMVIDDTVAFGYEDEVFLMTEITPPDTLSPDEEVEIGAKIRWLVCSDSTCLPGESNLSASLPVSSQMSAEDPIPTAQFTQAKKLLPTSAAKLGLTRHQTKADQLVLHLYELDAASQLNLDTAQFTAVEFFPENGLIDYKAVSTWSKVEGSAGHYTLSLALAEKSHDHLPSLKGLLVLKGIHQAAQKPSPNEGTSLSPESFIKALDIEVDLDNAAAAGLEQGDELSQGLSLPLEEHSSAVVVADVHKLQNAQNNAAAPESEGADAGDTFLDSTANSYEGGFGAALFFAFLGGLILNLMPCVLPVISLKILNFVQIAGQSRKLIFKHGLFFSLGVLLSFWALAGALLLLQAYGESVGWGFQLQDPTFVAILAAVFVVFGLSLFGVFETGTKLASWAGDMHSGSKGLAGSFFSGILATAVATPCTGPFLGAALGFALTLTPLWSMLIFTSLGLGMASPYILLTAFPSLLRRLPKPGMWMVTFKEFMGFIMLATTLWLIWVFGAQTNNSAVFLLLTGLLGLALAAWIFGKWGTPFQKPMLRYCGWAVSAVACSVGLYAILSAPQIEEMHGITQGTSAYRSTIIPKSQWEPYSRTRLAELQDSGVPVLVDFTAKWCLICQTNHRVLNQATVSSKLEDQGVVKMLADWTKNDPVITEELRKFGRSGVPLYVLYSGDAKIPPKILPQVLTADNVLEHLDSLDAQMK